MTRQHTPQAATRNAQREDITNKISSTFTRYVGSPLDEAMIRAEQLHALSDLLSTEEAVEQFANLSERQQVAIFGLLEHTLADVCSALVSVPSSD